MPSVPDLMGDPSAELGAGFQSFFWGWGVLSHVVAISSSERLLLWLPKSITSIKLPQLVRNFEIPSLIGHIPRFIGHLGLLLRCSFPPHIMARIASFATRPKLHGALKLTGAVKVIRGKRCI